MTRLLVPALLGILLSGCAPRVPQDRAVAPARAARVVLVSVDGLRPDAVDRAGATHLRRLIARGTYCPAAETIRPSITLPSHASMLTGLDFPRHGVVWNNYRPGRIPHPTLLSIVARRGDPTAFLFSKDKFHYLADPADGHWIYGPPAPLKAPREEDVTDPAYVERRRQRELQESREADRPDRPARPRKPKAGDLMTTADLLARAFVAAWPAYEFRFAFVHFRECDDAGHQDGWMSEPYLAAVRIVDAALGEIIRAVEAKDGFRETVLIVTSDHGGSGRGHHRVTEPDRRENVLIPWIAVGPGVPAGRVIAGPVRTLDTAATVLALLGLEAPAEMDGRPIADVLGPVPKAASPRD